MIAVFDTNIVIDALNGREEVEDEYKRYERVLISLITWMEVMVGEERNEKEVREFLESAFEVTPVDSFVAEHAVKLRRKYRIRLPDAMIWGTAQCYQAVLVTRNTKDFRPEWGNIRIPYLL